MERSPRYAALGYPDKHPDWGVAFPEAGDVCDRVLAGEKMFAASAKVVTKVAELSLAIEEILDMSRRAKQSTLLP